MVGLDTGSHQISKSRLVHQGRQIVLDGLEIELSPSGNGETTVFASALMKAKIPGLCPNDKDIQVVLEWEGKVYQIADATVFDVDLHPSGETTVQITGKLEPLAGEPWEDR